MADYSALTKKLVANAVIRQIPGLNRKVDFKLFVSKGVYDADTDTRDDIYNVIADVVVVEVKPTMQDVTNYGVSASTKKLLVPGASLPKPPSNEADKVVIGGIVLNISKVIGVPGDSLFTVFVSET